MAKSKKEKTITPSSVTFLLDRTGSMAMHKEATIAGFNTYIDTLKAEKTPIQFSLIQFDTLGVDKLYVRVDPKDVAHRDNENYQPRSGTPLIDAAVKTIRAVEATKPEGKVIICIQTDGEENSSTAHTWEELKGLIATKQADGWQFNFMGAGIDAYNQATRMGIAAVNTVAYTTDTASTQNAFRATARNTNLFRAGTTANVNYTAADRKEANDQWANKTVTPSAKPIPAPAKDDYSL